MSNQELNEKMLDLATKYLSGNATAEETQQLESWVLANPENKQQFTALKKSWMLSGTEMRKTEIDVDKSWDKISKGLDGEAETKSPAKVVPIRRFTPLRIAASIILLIAAGFLVSRFLGGEKAIQFATTDSSETFQLTDGSEVTLNQASTMKFEAGENASQRLVTLKGDAFFDVKRDEEKPFVIQTQNVEIEVLGTSFYVDSRIDEDEIQVIVQSGSVAVRSSSNETILKANEKAVFKKETGDLSKQNNDDPNFSSIKSNTLAFSNSTIEEVVYALNRQYNADISINITDTSSCRITTTFENKTLDFIVTVIEQTLGIDVEGEGKKAVLSGTKCN